MKSITNILLAAVGFVGAAYTVAGCSTQPADIHEDADEHVGATEEALTAAQCNYFAVNGKVQICHRTASVAHPFTVVKVSTQACIQAHAVHAGDYVAVNDPTCSGGGCLPEGAPCDATLGCCDGFSCTNGTCTPNVSDHCAPSPCQNGGSCVNNPSGYTCDCPAGYTGTNCETEIDECQSDPCAHGQCLDAINDYVCACDVDWYGTNCDVYQNGCDPNPCVNGQCFHDGLDYFCSCPAGWAGTNCDVNIDDCANANCNHGQCIDGINAYTCQCDAGWNGTNCDQQAVTSYNCSDRNPCTPENAANGQFFFPADDPNQFIQCSEFQQCYVMSCPPGLVWDTVALTCNYP